MSRNYTKLTIKLLFGQARGCAYPECETPLIYEGRGRETVVAKIEHIRSESPGGPRHDPAFAGDLNGPENLLLLCGVHHKPADRHDAIYSVEELKSWKEAQRSASGQGVDLSDAEAARFIQLAANERAAIETLARIGFRLEQAAAAAVDSLGAIDDEYQRAREAGFAALGPMYEIDDEGNRGARVQSSFNLPHAQIRGFQKRYAAEVQRHRGGAGELAALLGEEVAVIRMMDPQLGSLAAAAVPSASGMVEHLDAPDILAEYLGNFRAALQELYGAARERF
ncbi:hypothetical protein [Nocardioides stalactiti]|uniref:hypothetical protein n=1 Tax=Nocardioides stalactiti TaxID=2755356 RepID=UPI0016019BA9|nr:hypothetical protein [Nocardioides stalactiti]